MGVARSGQDTGAEREVFSGRIGVQRLSERVQFEPQDADAFQAEYRSLELTTCRFESFRVSACSGVIHAQPAGELETLVLGTLVAGRSSWRSDGQQHDQERGAVHLLRGFDHARFDWPQPALFLGIRFPLTTVAPHLLQPGVLRSGVLPRTLLTNGFGGFLHQLAAGPTALAAAERDQLDRALRALGSAVLALAASQEQLAEDELRFAIHDHIERHLLDLQLDPRQIAGSLGVSVRWVHQVFSRDGETVARFIRQRRLDLVAEFLRADLEGTGVSRLSQQFGFGGRDQLTRAFRTRFGMTIGQYRNQFRDGSSMPETTVPGRRSERGPDQVRVSG